MATKSFTRQLLVALFCFATAFNAWTYDLKLDGIYYNLSGNEAIVTYANEPGEPSYSGYVTIPPTITHDGTTYYVTTIGLSAFENCTELANITIPYSVTAIGNYAFYGCTNLYGSNGYPFFYFSNNISWIGDYAFGGGNAITRFVVDSNNNYFSTHNDILYNKDKTKLIFFPSSSSQTVLTSSSLPSALNRIGNGAFGDCDLLTRVELPGTLTTIGAFAFDNTSGLNRVVIPESVSSISICAFRYDFDIDMVVCLVPTPLEIDDEAFSCYSKATLVVPRSSLTAYKNANEWKYFSSIKAANFDFVLDGVYYKITDSTNKTVAVVRALNEQNFNSTDYVGTVDIPSTVNYGGSTYTVTRIDDYAFYYNKQLREVYLPQTVTTIGERAFYGCESLAVLAFSEGLTEIGPYSISLCRSLTSLTLPETLNSIGEYAFYSCSGLTQVIIPDAVTTIDRGAFYSCSSLESVVLGSRLTSIGANAFNSCNALTGINSMATTPPAIESNTFTTQQYNNAILTVPKVALNAYQEAQYWSNFSTIEQTGTTFEFDGIYYYINDDGSTATVTYRDTNYNSYSGDVEIPSSVTHNGTNYKVNTIGKRAFYNCRTLQSVTMPYWIDSIGNYSFDNCTALTSITLPSEVTVIGDYAFYGCTSLSTISLNNKLKTISQFSLSHTGLTAVSIPSSVDSITSTAFTYCNSLRSITVNPYNTKYCSIGNVLFSKNRKTLVAYPNAHADDYSVPDGTEIIMNNAFRGGETLAHVNLPTSLRVIEHAAFSDNVSLEEIVVPHGVTTIEERAFAGCSGMSRAELPSTLTSIGHSAFSNVPDLTELVVKATTPPTCQIYIDPKTHTRYEVFMEDHYSNVNLTVPTGSKSAYQAASTWKKFLNIGEEVFPIEANRGDVNADGTVSISDVTALIDYLLGSDVPISTGSDCNLDGTISIADVTTLIDYLLGSQWGEKKSIELWCLYGSQFGDSPWSPSGFGLGIQPMYPIQGNSYDNNGHGIIEYTGFFTTNNFFLITKTDLSEFINNDGGAFCVDASGYYTIRLNTATREVSIIPLSGIRPPVYSTMSVAGDFNGWVTQSNFMTPINQCAPENHDWYLSLNLTSNTDMKFVHEIWEAYWGSEAFPYGTGFAEGLNIPVPAGEYQVIFNDITGNYIFVPSTYPWTPEW